MQVVHCTMSHLWNLAMIPSLRAAGAKYVLTLHDAVPHPGERYGVRRSMIAHEVAQADRIVTLSDHVRDQAVELHDYPPNAVGSCHMVSSHTPARRNSGPILSAALSGSSFSAAFFLIRDWIFCCPPFPVCGPSSRGWSSRSPALAAPRPLRWKG